MMKKKVGFFSLFLVFFALNGLAKGDYTTPKQFMDLYFDFTGTGEPDFPKGETTIAQYLLQSEAKNNRLVNLDGPLIMLLDSSIYVYDKQRKLLFSQLLRTNRHTGFFEMTAVSHVGPALSYLAKIKQNGDSAWKPAMEQLLNNIRAVKALNAEAENNWLTQADIKAWQPHKQQINNLVDYAMSMAGNYIVSVLNGASFTPTDLQHHFLDGNEQYPISYNTVMVATFMLTALESMATIHDEFKKLNLDWENAMVIVRNVAGGNVSAGVSVGSNWMVPLINALSDNTLPADRLFIMPYAKVTANVGQDPLPESDFNYYRSIWASTYNRIHIANQVFTNITSTYLPARPAIPGDYGYSKASDIMDFMMRLKFSLANATEMLSNTVGFWMAGELQSKNWDVASIEIPGLTTGFPEGIEGYPAANAEIVDVNRAAFKEQKPENQALYSKILRFEH